MILNREDACDILDIPYNFTEKELRTQYKKLALKYHPDRNKYHNNRFLLIKEAYEFLSNDINTPLFTFNDYYELLNNFLTASNINIDIEILYNIIHKLFTQQKYNILDSFKLLSYSNGLKIYQFLKKYNELFDLSNTFLNEIYTIIQGNNKHNNIYHIFYPTINDLYLHNIFKYTHLNEDYYIPSWHEELHFRINEHQLLILKCIPKLSKQITIDNDNNIHFTIHTNMNHLMKKKELYFKIGTHKSIPIFVNQLFIKEKQCVKYLNHGIPKINIDDTYNNLVLSNLYIHIHLH